MQVASDTDQAAVVAALTATQEVAKQIKAEVTLVQCQLTTATLTSQPGLFAII